MDGKKKHKLRFIDSRVPAWLITAALAAVGLLFISDENRKIYIIGCAVTLVLFIITELIIFAVKKKMNSAMVMQTPFYKDGTEEGLGSVENFALPMVFTDLNGDIIWSNEAFNQLFTSEDAQKNSHNMKRTIKEIFVLRVKSRLMMDEEAFSMDVAFAGRNFIMQGNVLENSIMLYFVDDTGYRQLQERTEDSAIAVGIIVLDSYEEIYQSEGESVVNLVTAELGKMFDRWLEGKNAVLRKLVRDRYILLIEKQYLKQLERDRFAILDEAKSISVGNRNSVTLSIGISLDGGSILDNYVNAEEAAKLALERGGDQVALREGGKDTYYGGSSVELERRNKVKARVIAAQLKSEIEKSSTVLIMGHANGDMDSLGASLAVYRACRISNVEAKIVLNKSNKSIDTMVNTLAAIPEYKELFITTTDALNLVDQDSLAVVVDTYKQALTEAPKVLDYVNRAAVIDHHRRGADFIKDTTVFYSETYASSTCELMVEILDYYTDNVFIPHVEAEAMYAGIWVDTKSFTFKTGIRTFEAASFLRAQGVDTVEVRKYFQIDFETYSYIRDITSTTSVINGNIGIAVCGSDVPNAQLLSAMAADQLLTVAEIDASFVISQIGSDANISGRSLGDINVQIIMEKLGGGGHLTSAGTRLTDTSVEEARELLIKTINEVVV